MKTKKLEIVKKAFVVWHEGMLDRNPHEGYTIESLPVTYADTSGQAKQIASIPSDFYLHDKPHRFIDLKVRRAPNADKVMFEGNVTTPNAIQRDIEEKEVIAQKQSRVTARTLKVDSYPDDAKFYIGDGYVGNCILWWGLNSNGRVCNITEAQLYSKTEVLKRFVAGSENIEIWESTHVLASIKPMVDHQYLNSEFVS